MTHFARNSRTTSETLRSSAPAFAQAASQRSSERRMLRAVVPLAIDGGDEFVGVDAVDVGGSVAVFSADGEECVAVGGLFDGDGVAVLVGVGEEGWHGVPFTRCTHTLTQGVPTPQGGMS